MIRTGLAGIALGTLLVASPVSAQQSEPAVEALAAFEAGTEAYDDGRFEDALGHFRRAYEITPSPEILYNVATTADRLRRDEEALAAYEEYLERFPEAESRGNVEARVRILRDAIARDAVAPPVEGEGAGAGSGSGSGSGSGTGTGTGSGSESGTGTGTGTESGAGAGPGIAPWLLLAGGAVVAAAGGVMVGFWASDVSTVSNGTMWVDSEDAYSRAGALGVTGAVLLAVGGAALVSGLVWALLSGSDEPPPVAVGLGPGSLSLAGRF